MVAKKFPVISAISLFINQSHIKHYRGRVSTYANKTQAVVCTREVRVEVNKSDKKKVRLKQIEKFKYLSTTISERKEWLQRRSKTSNESWMGKVARSNEG